ncbi:MAG: SMP-30/gluconolactonase/LRE family protein, partial [Bifidobacteriaceae bacterium]|nr:SMP-30/gluconolactonase/LRE family protein [Bifidobacteriaceae bacterium]
MFGLIELSSGRHQFAADAGRFRRAGRAAAVVAACAMTVTLSPSLASAAPGGAAPTARAVRAARAAAPTPPARAAAAPRSAAATAVAAATAPAPTADRTLMATDGRAPTGFTVSQLLDVGLNSPADLVLDSGGNLYVSDSGNNRIAVFDAAHLTGGPVRPDHTITAGLKDPQGLAFDQAGNLWVADSGNNRAAYFTKANLTGGPVAPDHTISAGLSGPDGVALDAAGNLYIADTGNNRVAEYNVASLATNPAAPDFRITGLAKPSEVVFNGTTLYVADTGANRIAVYAGAASLAANLSAVTHTVTGVKNPRGVEFDTAGNLYVADSGNNRVAVYNKAVLGGNPTGPNRSITGLSNPWGLVFDTAGTLYVADDGNNQVAIFSQANLSTKPTAPDLVIKGGLSNSEGLGFDSAGNLYVADLNNNRISIFTATQLKSGTAPSGPAHTITAGISYPSGLAFDNNGDLYVNNTGNANVTVYAKAGLLNNPRVSHTISGLGSPMALAFDTDGNLYVSDSGNQRIAIYNKAVLSGNPTNPNRQVTGFPSPMGLGFDQQGNLYVADQSRNCVYGVVRSRLAASTSGASYTISGLNYPQDVVFDKSGNLYVANEGANNVAIYDAARLGKNLSGADQTISQGLSRPVGVAFDGDNGLYVVESDSVLVFKKTGLPGLPMAAIGNGLSGLGGLTFDNAAANLYVADWRRNRIDVFATSKLTSHPMTPDTVLTGAFNGPRGIALDRNGNLYVADSGNNRVAVFNSDSLSGNITTPNTTITGLKNPQDVAFDQAGNLYVADDGNNRVAIFNVAALAANSSKPSATITAIAGPTGVALDGSDNLYVTSASQAGVFPKADVMAGPAAAEHTITGLTGASGIAVDPDGNVYIADTGAKRVAEYRASGLASNPTKPDVVLTQNLVAPQDVMFAADGDLYATDLNAGVIQAVPVYGHDVTGRVTSSVSGAGVPGVAVSVVIPGATSASDVLVAGPATSTADGAFTVPFVPDRDGYMVKLTDDAYDTNYSASFQMEGQNMSIGTVTVTPHWHVAVTLANADDAEQIHGTVDQADQVVTNGQPAQITLTPATGYHVSAFLDNGTNALSSITDGVYRIDSVTVAHTLAATFAIDTFQLAVSVPYGGGQVTTTVTGGEGSVDPGTNTATVDYGGSATFTMLADDGSKPTAVSLQDGKSKLDALVQDESIDNAWDLTLTNITAADTLTVEFGKTAPIDSDTIGAGGTVTVTYENDTRITITGLTKCPFGGGEAADCENLPVATTTIALTRDTPRDAAVIVDGAGAAPARATP